jgi:glycerophosphoryl diester phosphodiesterase
MDSAVAWPFPRVVAHRGGGTEAPENTIAAIEAGRLRGYAGVEFDVMLAADQVPVLLHDDTLERTTSGRGPAALLTAAELGTLDAGAWHSSRFVGERVPSFDAAVRHCRRHSIWINVEIKPAPGADVRTGSRVAQATEALYRDAVRPGGDAARRVCPAVPLLSSFSPQSLAAARTAAPDLPRGLLLERWTPAWRDMVAQLDCVSLHIDHKELDRERAAAIRGAGIWLFCYTVNTVERALELFDWGVDSFCTDRIDLIPPSLGR